MKIFMTALGSPMKSPTKKFFALYSRKCKTIHIFASEKYPVVTERLREKCVAHKCRLRRTIFCEAMLKMLIILTIMGQKFDLLINVKLNILNTQRANI